MAQVVDIGYRPRKWQHDFHVKRRRFTVLVVHRRAGKTVASIGELIDKALRCDKPQGRFGYIAPLRNQAKTIAWTYLKDLTKEIPGRQVNEAELRIDFANGARITLFGADNPDSIRGAYFDGVVLDEYADIHPDTWSKIIRPMLADRKGWAVFLGTPKGHDQFFEVYQKATKRMDEGNASWFAKLLPYWETDALDPDEIEAAKEEMGDEAFAQEFCCDFSVEATNALIPIALVEDAIKRELTKDAYTMAAKVMGVDVARFGDDRSVIQKRQGLYAHEPIVMKGLDNMEVADRVAYEINAWKPDAVFIDEGRGEGVIDRLRQLGYRIVNVNFGGKSTNARYANKATEMWAGILQSLKDGLSLPPDHPEYLTELTARKYEFISNGSIKLEEKKKMKERFRSPDLADALALTYAQPVAPHVDVLHHTPNKQKAAIEYEPF